MKNFRIETTEHPAVDLHPELKGVMITWLRWDEENSKCYINVNYATEEHLKEYLHNDRDWDAFDYVQAKAVMDEFWRTHESDNSGESNLVSFRTGTRSGRITVGVRGNGTNLRRGNRNGSGRRSLGQK